MKREFYQVPAVRHTGSGRTCGAWTLDTPRPGPRTDSVASSRGGRIPPGTDGQSAQSFRALQRTGTIRTIRLAEANRPDRWTARCRPTDGYRGFTAFSLLDAHGLTPAHHKCRAGCVTVPARGISSASHSL